MSQSICIPTNLNIILLFRQQFLVHPCKLKCFLNALHWVCTENFEGKANYNKRKKGSHKTLPENRNIISFGEQGKFTDNGYSLIADIRIKASFKNASGLCQHSNRQALQIHVEQTSTHILQSWHSHTNN